MSEKVTLEQVVEILKQDRELKKIIEMIQHGKYNFQGKLGDLVDFTTIRERLDRFGIALGWSYAFKHYDLEGRLIHAQTFHNLVTDAGINHILDVGLNSATSTATWYMGLMEGAAVTPAPAITDTMASHAGWTELTAYSEADRQVFTASVPASKATNNTGNEAVFSINASQTVEGAFLTDTITKGGATGILYSAAASGAEEVFGGAGSLSVGATFSGADDGA